MVGYGHWKEYIALMTRWVVQYLILMELTLQMDKRKEVVILIDP